MQGNTISTTPSGQYKIKTYNAHGIVQLAHGLGLHYYGVLQNQYPNCAYLTAKAAVIMLKQANRCKPIAGAVPKVVMQNRRQGTITCPYGTYTVYVNASKVYAILPNRKALNAYKATVSQIYNG